MKLTVIGTFHGRHQNTLPLLKRLYIDSTRKPDQVFLMCEDTDDVDAVVAAYRDLYELELLDEMPAGLDVRLCPTPREGSRYKVLPYAWKINEALGLTTGDAVVYLDNNSDPKPSKYHVMMAGLEAHPEWGAVYCTQQRTGMNNHTAFADDVVVDGFCAVNYTQVMHRLTADRWPLDMALANPDLADGVFWRSLHLTLGDFYPVGGPEILDEHHIPHAHADGVGEAPSKPQSTVEGMTPKTTQTAGKTTAKSTTVTKPIPAEKAKVVAAAKKPAPKPPAVKSPRERFVEQLRWGCKHEPQIHYAQTRPIPVHLPVGTLPITTDCSGYVILCAKWAGVTDPARRGFDGEGYTGTFLDALDHVSPSHAQPGDLIVYGTGTGHHVVAIIERRGSDFLCVSHGQERGPFEVLHSVEQRVQPLPASFLSFLP